MRVLAQQHGPQQALHRRLEDGARLHLVDFGIGDAHTAAAMPQPRGEFVQVGRAPLELVDRDTRRRRDIGEFAFLMRQEFV
ncbi:hypothetical protein G6F65_023308 [Rhizopus arrhizus]|nr:hypothetical protein G6F65_023308 [Rhizopus arrhizus]